MNKDYNNYKKFLNTGKVEDYLNYCGSKGGQYGVNSFNENNNTGGSPAGLQSTGKPGTYTSD